MSMDFGLYTRDLSDDLIPEILKRLNNFDMEVEIHPEFSFEDQTGYLPFKFKFTKPPFEILRDKILQSGFELDIDDFDLDTEIENSKPKRNIFDKLFNRPVPASTFVNPEIDSRLKNCTKDLMFAVHSEDDFELRFALLTRAIISELVDGVCFDTEDGTWPGNMNIVKQSYETVKLYEESLKEEDIDYLEFEEWG
jgi:hypothetical protein